MSGPRFSLFVGLILGFDVIRWSLLVYFSDISLAADAGHYWQLGHSVADGDWLLRKHVIAYRTPGYPWFLGAVLSLFPGESPQAIAVVQGCLLSATHGLTACIVHQLTYNRRAVIISLLLSVGCMARATWICTILTETLFTFALVLHLWCCVRWILCEKNFRSLSGWAIASGFTYAAVLLVRPVATYMLGVHLIALLVAAFCTHQGCVHQPWARATAGRWSMSIIWMLVFAIVPLLPWLARNQQMFGQAKMTEFVGRNIWIVTYQGGAGAGLPLPTSSESKDLLKRLSLQSGVDVTRTWQVSGALTQSGLDDVRTDQLMQKVAWQSIQRQPGHWCIMALRRWINFYRCVSDQLPVIGYAWLSHHLWWCNLWMLLGTAAVMRGLIHPMKRAWMIWMVGLVLYFGLITALVEIPDYRYRMIAEPLFVIMMALGISPRHNNGFQAHNGTSTLSESMA